MFTLEALNAEHGDALLLHYGTATKRRLIMIDAGPAGVYQASVRPRLEKLRGTQDSLPLRMVMVSHVDADHITGVIELFKDLAKAKDKGKTVPYDIATLWFNSFKKSIEKTGVVKPAEVSSGVSLASLGDGKASGLKLHPDVLADLASVSQGVQLQGDAEAMGIGFNSPFPDLVIAPATGLKQVDIGDGLSFTVIGPNQQRIDKLKADWAKKTKTAKVKPAELAAYVDNSVYNLSSIVVLATFGGKKMLLTGDARGDDILGSLTSAKLLTAGKLHLDILKLPHHGSIRDADQDFFEKITADHYVISANGKYENPDVATLKLLTAARGSDAYTIWLTNKVARVTTFFAKDQKPPRKYKVQYRADQALSLEVAL